MNVHPLIAAAFASTAFGQSVIFTDQFGLLSSSGISGPPFSSGLGLGAVDVNGDGRDDIVRVHNNRQLSIETQNAPGAAFGHYLVGTVTTSTAWSVTAADVDRNGINDLLIGGNFGGNGPSGLELFVGNATGTSFVPSMVKTGGIIVQGSIFTDLDNDGDLDIFACDDVADLEKFENDGTGSFTANQALLPTDFANPFDDSGNYALVATDYDNDGDTDYYLSKCQAGEGSNMSLRRINRLFINDGSENFSEVSGAAGLADGEQSWTADFGDVDNDGDLDCFVVNHEFAAGHSSGNGPSGESAFYRNNGAGTFTEDTAASGLAGGVNFMGAQCLFRDFNNDGWVDLLVSSLFLSNYAYFQNDGDGTFTEIPGAFQHASGGGPVAHIQSFAVGDLNRDGFLDVYASRGNNINLTTNLSDLLFFNGGNGNGFLSVRLAGSASNANGIGARLEAHGPFGAGGATAAQIREVRGGESYGIMNSLNTHFGLAGVTQLDKLVVRWPSGTVDEIPAQPEGQFITVYEGTNAAALEYPDWIAQFYPGGGPDALFDADPDGDRIDSIIEQVLGTRPDQPNGMRGLTLEVIEDGGQDYVRLSLERVPTVGVTLGVEFSTNGMVWNTDPALEVLEDGPLSYMVRVPVDLAATPVLLVRLTGVSAF